tara:strand:+ start:1480 stop:2136 length:657 start_codon:yes stop_codon:yes gene_type:complete
MARKKTVKKHDLISMFMEFVLENDHPPKSVFSFAKENNFEEASFYEFFGSFEALEGAVFETFFENTLQLLSKSEEYQDYDARNKLLSFYFTFFELLTANRSYVVYAFNKGKNNLKSLQSLKGFHKHFKQFIDHLDIETLDIQQDQIEKFQHKALQESAWIQLLVTMKFWLDDTSSSFEKTDIFIEKSVNTSFDLLNIKPLKSIIDFGKFLFKEKMMQK